MNRTALGISGFALLVSSALAADRPAGEPPAVNGSVALARALEAHGGLARWRSFGTLQYTLVDFPLSEATSAPSRAVFDLRGRAIRIEAERFSVVHDGARTFAAPSAEFIGLPPRFFAKGSSYFVIMPFVFADAGITARDAAPLHYAGKAYDVVNIGYAAGVGDVRDDYQLLIDPETDRLFAVNHSVRETGIERVTWVFDEWQSVEGVLIPARMSLRLGFDPVNPGEGKQARIEQASLQRSSPAPQVFSQVPPGAVEVDAGR